MENFILFTLSLEKLTILSGMLLVIAIVFIAYDIIIRYKANKTVVNESVFFLSLEMPLRIYC